MISDDEVMSLFARADPARSGDVESDLDVPRALDDMRRRGAAEPVVDLMPTRSAPTNGHQRRTLVAAAAAAVVIVAGALLLVAGGTTDPASGQTSAVPSTSSTPSQSPSDPADAFALWAERRGTPVVRPACHSVAGDTASAVTCYGLMRNESGGGFNAVLVATVAFGDPGTASTFNPMTLGPRDDATATTTTATS